VNSPLGRRRVGQMHILIGRWTEIYIGFVYIVSRTYSAKNEMHCFKPCCRTLESFATVQTGSCASFVFLLQLGIRLCTVHRYTSEVNYLMDWQTEIVCQFLCRHIVSVSSIKTNSRLYSSPCNSDVYCKFHQRHVPFNWPITDCMRVMMSPAAESWIP
jgi:hypothetical protein